ncbi:FtsX-like permease family protein [Gaetbulibacter aestuarii]|uniref:FtsX-like permease family protein n=1 Tax=Gaetbulibacter aestuarii TaxID=1502358 RepID=A0ABW7MUZ4_9FLAO
MNVSYYIAKRYLRSKSSNNAINVMTYIAITGIILGAASLFIVLSGFAGLKDFTLKFTSVVDPDLKAETATGKSFFISNEQLQALDTLKDVAQYSKIIEERVVLNYDKKNYLAKIKGVDENFSNVVAIDSVIEYGNWLEPKTDQIVVGWGISNNLSMGVLDYTKPVDVYVPKPGTGQITSTRNAFSTVRTQNVGIFAINDNYDDSYVFASLPLTQKLLNYKPNQISGIEFQLASTADEDTVKQQLKTILGNQVIIKNRAQLNDALYKMLNTENLVVYLIFTLVLIIAFFNIIGSLIMMMLDKKKSLNTLFNLGATVKNIRRIFFLQGSLMSIIGGTLGLLLALILILLQQRFSMVMITPSLPYPVNIKIENIFIVLSTIIALGVIASKIASVRISKALVATNQ